MRLFIFPPSARVLAIVALKDYLNIECEIVPVDLSKGEQRTRDTPRGTRIKRCPCLKTTTSCSGSRMQFCSTSQTTSRRAGFGPPTCRGRLTFCAGLPGRAPTGMRSLSGWSPMRRLPRSVLGLGPPDPSFVARGQQNFARFATVLNESLKGRAWLTGDALTIADFSVAGLVPSAERMQLPVKQFPEVVRWYAALAALPAWHRALEVKNASMAAWQASHANNAKPELTLK